MLGDYEHKTWLEVENLKKTQQEYKRCEVQRKSIFKKFKQIQKFVQQLLSKNLEGPEDEYLDIQDFNLDTELKETKWHENHGRCKQTKTYMEKLVVAEDQVSEWIKEFCWNTMRNQGQTLFGIFSEIWVENYVLLPENPKDLELANFIEEHRILEEMMAHNEIFEPWVPKATRYVYNFMFSKRF